MAATKKGIVEGIDYVVYARLLDEAESADAQRIALQTDGELSEKSKTDTVQTKDGSTTETKGTESELSCTALLDRKSGQYKWLVEAQRAKKVFQLWLVDMKSSDTDADKEAQYFQGVISERKDKFDSEGKMEVEVTFAISGTGKFGTTPVPTFVPNANADYEFKTTAREVKSV